MLAASDGPLQFESELQTARLMLAREPSPVCNLWMITWGKLAVKPVAKVVPKLTQRAMWGRSSYELALRRDWSSLVGEELDRWARPARLVAPKSGGTASGAGSGANRQGAVLELSVQRAFVLEIQQTSPQILQAVNRYFGFDLVASLRIKQTATPFPERVKIGSRAHKRDFDLHGAAADLSSLPPNKIQDPELAARLARLQAIIKQKSTGR